MATLFYKEYQLSTFIPGRSSTLAILLALAGSICAEEESTSYPGWPNWRGAGCNGAASEQGLDYVDSLADARQLWRSEQMVAGTYHGAGCGKTCSGPSSPIAADGKVFLYYYDAANTSKVSPFNSKKKSDAEHWYQKANMQAVMSKDEFVRLWCNAYAEDRILCMDAQTGKTLWQRTLAGLTPNTKRSSSKWEPAYANGLLVAASESGTVSCLDAKTGEIKWEWVHKPWAVRAESGMVAIARNPQVYNRWGKTNSLMIADGVAFVPMGHPKPEIHAFDLKTGKLLWDHLTIDGKKQKVSHSVPLRWIHKGKEYVVIGNTCFEPRTGKVVWRAKGATHGGRNLGTMALSEDYAVVNVGEGRGLTCFRIAPGKAEHVWTVEPSYGEKPTCMSPSIYNNHAYGLRLKSGQRGESVFVAVELATGKVVQHENLSNAAHQENSRHKGTCRISSSFAFGGRICYRSANNKATGHVIGWSAAPRITKEPQFFKPESYDVAATPCVAEGKMFLRGAAHVLGYDLLKPGSTKWPTPEDDPACKNMEGPMAGLGSPFKTERENAAQAVAAAGKASVGPVLVDLIRHARFTTAEAAGLALSQLKESDSANTAALKKLADDPTLTITRLGVVLHAWHGYDPEAAADWLRSRLQAMVDAKDSKGVRQLAQMLRQHRFLDSALIELTAPDLGATLAIANAATVNALGHVLMTLCEEPELLVPLIDPLIQALKRVNANGCYSATLALQTGLWACKDNVLKQKVSDFALWELKAAMASGDKYRIQSITELLRQCPRAMVAEKVLQALEGKHLRGDLERLAKYFEKK